MDAWHVLELAQTTKCGVVRVHCLSVTSAKIVADQVGGSWRWPPPRTCILVLPAVRRFQGSAGTQHCRAHAPLDMDDPVAQLGRVGAIAALAGEARGQGGVLAVELADQTLQGVAAKAGVLRGDCRARKLLGCSGEAAVRAARHAVQPLPQRSQVLERALRGPRRAADGCARGGNHPCL